MNNIRIRKSINKGWTTLVGDELEFLNMGVISLDRGESYQLKTGEREFALVLISGECKVSLESGLAGTMGPRSNPFDEPPYGLFVTREELIHIKALRKTLIGVGSAPAKNKMTNSLVTPDQTGGGMRGAENWERQVRFVCWSDNTEGNMLMAGETCTPSGNWSTMPPHRHQFHIPGEEVPYEELYFFQFSRPNGFGLLWHFDDDGLDQAYSLKNGDVMCIKNSYHPLVSGPGSTLYHLTFMAGPHRMSRSSVHPDFDHLLEEKGMDNPFQNQFIKPNK